MTEAEWAACTDPKPMQESLRTSGTPNERKLRLLAVACCRRIRPLLVHEISRTCLVAAERYADGLASREELAVVNEESERSLADAWHGPFAKWHEAWAAMAVDWACWVAPPDEPAEPFTWFETEQVMAEAARAEADRKAYIGPPFGYESAGLDPDERRHQADLVRESFGPRGFREVRSDPAWLAWNGGTVVKLAQAAYEDRTMPEGTLDRTRLAVLADALEEAGCDQPDLLDHLRGPGPHVRGCWALDLLVDRR